MKIIIPCPMCGCQHCMAKTDSGEEVRIEICHCNDGSGEYEVSIIPNGSSEIIPEKHQCSKEDIEACLISRYTINLESLSHKCTN